MCDYIVEESGRPITAEEFLCYNSLSMSNRRKLRESCSAQPCGKLLSTDPTATCDDCKNKYHLQCTDLSTEIRDVIAAQTFSEGLFYRCPECRTKPKFTPVDKNEFDLKMNELSEKLNSLTSEFSKRLDSIENQNIAFPKEVKESITNYAQVVSNNIKENCETKKVVSTMSKTMKNLENNLNTKLDEEQSSLSAINEDLKTVKLNIERNDEKEIDEKQRAQKINNVCIFNVPEFDSTDAEVNYKNDIKIIKTVLNGKVDLGKNDVKAMYRKGNDEASKPRPIIIKFSSHETKIEILKLRNIVYNDSKKDHQIFIAPDRTTKEQALHRELVQKMKERREKGEENIGIRNGKIVNLQPFRANPQLYWG